LIAISVGLFLGTVTKYALLRAATELQDERVEPGPIPYAFLALANDSHEVRGKPATIARARKLVGEERRSDAMKIGGKTTGSNPLGVLGCLSMGKLEASVCPSCRAPLNVHAAATEILCPYCGTLAHVGGGSEPKPMSPVGGPPRMVVGVSPPAVPPAVWLTLAIVGIALVAAAAFATSRRGAGPGKASGLSPEAIMLGDVNGDGVPDVVGEFHDSQRLYLAAFDGATGKPLWRGPSRPMATRGGQRAVVGDKLIAIDDLGKVEAYRLGSGAPAWSGVLGERAKEFCADGGSVLVRTSDDAWTRLELATGKKSHVTPAGLPPGARGERSRPPCNPVYATSSRDSPRYRSIDAGEFDANRLPDLPTPEVLGELALVPSEPGPTFFVGFRLKGTAVAMVAAVNGGNVIWKDVVPGVDPLTTDLSVKRSAAAGDGRVVVPYGSTAGKGARMACFDGRTGQRLWDVALQDAPSVGLAIEAGRVYYATGRAVYALSLANGAPLFALGP
jgi:LSD1 subclass zinc finger protein